MTTNEIMKVWEGKTYLSDTLIVSVDFDGTITTNPKISPEALTLYPHCKEVLEKLYYDGVALILWTCRTGGYLEMAKQFLRENVMLDWFSCVNEHLPQITDKYTAMSIVLSRKIGSDINVDNCNVFFKPTEDYWLRVEDWIYGR